MRRVYALVELFNFAVFMFERLFGSLLTSLFLCLKGLDFVSFAVFVLFGVHSAGFYA
jgi:hypothetical protein